MAQAAIAYRQSGKPTRFLTKIEDHWKDTLIADMSAEAVRQSARKLYPGAKGATWNRQVIVPTQAMINFAAGFKWCLPIKVKRFPVETKTKKPATHAWVESFAANASLHLGALCLFMFGTGARIGEACALTWADVDLSSGTVVIHQTKVLDTRTAHLHPRLIAALANIGGNRCPDDAVFRYAGPGSVKQVWDNAVERAGIVRLTPHSCRHGFATTLLHKGLDVKTVAKLGGWKDAGTVLRTYAHARDDMTLTNVLFDTNLAQDLNADPATNRNKRVKSK